MPGISRSNEQVISADSAEILLSPDGRTVVLQYAVGEDKINVGLPLDVTRDLLGRMMQVVSATPDGSGFVRLTPVTGANAHPTDIPDHFILTLLDELKLPHHFAFPAELSARLRPVLRNAEASSKRGVQTGRA